MRIIEESERHVIFEGQDMPPEMWVHPVRVGGHRRRMQPSSLTIRWERYNDNPWRLREFYLFGNSLSHYLFQRVGPTWQEDRDIKVANYIPKYVVTHVARSAPPGADYQDWL